jgi:hypothetical protein
LELGDDDTKVATASRRESGKINSHSINLTLPVKPFKSAQTTSASWPLINPFFAQFDPSIAFFRDEKHREIEPDRHEDSKSSWHV